MCMCVCLEIDFMVLTSVICDAHAVNWCAIRARKGNNKGDGAKKQTTGTGLSFFFVFVFFTDKVKNRADNNRLSAHIHIELTPSALGELTRNPRCLLMSAIDCSLAPENTQTPL